jgi:hypothetical protein
MLPAWTLHRTLINKRSPKLLVVDLETTRMKLDGHRIILEICVQTSTGEYLVDILVNNGLTIKEMYNLSGSRPHQRQMMKLYGPPSEIARQLFHSLY